MAIWQVRMHLVNRDGSIFKENTCFPHSLETLAKTFPEEKSWCNTIKQYGSLASTCLEIECLDNEIQEEISLRVDLRSITKSQLQAICDFANENDLIIKYHDTVYECSMEILSSLLRESEANAFLTDPRKFLQEK